MSRLPVRKTYKLYIGGKFPRSESGRTFEAEGQNVARASRKDVRDAVRAARSALSAWSGATAYNRGQVLYRLAEMMESRAADLASVCSGARRGRAGDRPGGLVRRLDRQAGPGAGLVQPGGRSLLQLHGAGADRGGGDVGASIEPALDGLVARIAPALAGGNVVVAVASSAHPLAACELAEAVATSDMPGGAVNLLTGHLDELAPVLAGHQDVNAIDLTGVDGDGAELERLAASNVKRVVRSDASKQSPWEIERLLEMKTVWHPIGV